MGTGIKYTEEQKEAAKKAWEKHMEKMAELLKQKQKPEKAD